MFRTQIWVTALFAETLEKRRAPGHVVIRIRDSAFRYAPHPPRTIRDSEPDVMNAPGFSQRAAYGPPASQQ